ncbi:MAG: penicillin-binding protein 2 [Elusimicrobia bacterium]|nr:penicillin-binding protein 2 [Elusimicrobiota bacterium]
MVWEGETDLVRQRFTVRAKNILHFVFFCFFVIILRTIYLQGIRGEYYYRVSEQNRTHIFVERAPRGNIFDRYGNVLCGSMPIVKVLFYPFALPASKSPDEIGERVERIIPGSRQKIYSSWKTQTVVCLSEDTPREQIFKLIEQKVNLSGISVVTEMRRHYPYRGLFSHIVGYISEIGPEELADPGYFTYKRGDIIGKSGVEARYDSFLRGIDGGWLIQADASGRQTDVVQQINTQQGNELFLTVDTELQKIARDALVETGHAGAVVGIDPSDGGIRILVSYPDFDPNLFSEGNPLRLSYFGDNALPLYNRAVQAQYPPGSVFKIITSLAALTNGKIGREEEFFCPGYLRVGNKVFKCWEEKGHKKIDWTAGVVNSCNVYFYNVGLKTGIELIEEESEKFLLGRTLGIDIPSEKPGFIPTEKWRKKTLRYGWLSGDTANIAIGQGYLTATPLQLASIISCVASRGAIWKPYLVAEARDSSGKTVYRHKPKKIAEIDIKEDIWSAVQDALVKVVESGTGRAAKVQGITFGGKTGTSQNPHGKDHSLFIAWGPVENPQLALAVVVEHGGKGGSVAAPVARKIFSRLKEAMLEKSKK